MKIRQLLITGFLLATLFAQNSIDTLTIKNYDAKISKGIAVVEYWATWNEANKVLYIETLTGATTYGRVNIDLNSDLQLKHNVIVVPTIIFYDEGKEFKRLQGDLSFTLVTTKKDLQKIIDEILMSKF